MEAGFHVRMLCPYCHQICAYSGRFPFTQQTTPFIMVKDYVPAWPGEKANEKEGKNGRDNMYGGYGTGSIFHMDYSV